MTLLESARALMAAWAMVLAESMYDWLGEALLSSTRPPRTTPWLYDQLWDLLIKQLLNASISERTVEYIRCLSIVCARVSQSVVNGVVRVDQTTCSKPIPFFLCPINVVRRVVWHTVGKMSGDGKEQLVGDSVDVLMV